jgi:acyl-CoA reductase-like NAD-dependent aldehyde dehydrogenase
MTLTSAQAGTIRNPATGEVAGEVRWTDFADVPRIVARLAAAQRDWDSRGAKGRAQVLARYALWLGEHRGEIEDLLVKETGKSRADATREVPLLIMILSYYIKTMEKALAPETRPPSQPFLAIKKIKVHYRPRPVVGIIAPWNFPVANALMDVIGALAAGCAVLLKPSERTPLTAEVLARGWRACGAPEVFALAQGAREVSEAVIDNVDFVQFTGSSATGRKLMERAARRLTPVSLELGGKDPMIVLEHADIKLAAHAAVWGSMFNAGQLCVSVERVYVHERVYDEFVDAVVRDVDALKVGTGEGYNHGSLIDENQLAVIERHVADARAKGARVLTGGRRMPGRGVFYPPTVLVEVDHSMTCMTDETFGPTLPIMKVSNESEAVRLANDSPYGLSASVFSGDLQRAKEIAMQLPAPTTTPLLPRRRRG